MTDRLRLKRGDTAPAFRARCTSTLPGAHPAPADLTGAEARLLLRDAAGVTRSLPLVTEAGGWVQGTWAEGDLAVAGTYDGEVEVVYAGGGRQTFPGAGYFTLEVLPDLG